jgi:hypothetical protein
VIFVGRYYRWLVSKALDAGKYGSLSEMKWQVLPWWIGGFGIMFAGSYWPLQSTIWWTFLVAGAAIWILGIGTGSAAFIATGFNRKRLEKERRVNDG